jgi:hypothetical protein
MIANVVPFAISLGSHETRLLIFVPEHFAAKLTAGAAHHATTRTNQISFLLVFISPPKKSF